MRRRLFQNFFVSCTISLSFSLNFPSFIWYHLLFLFNKSPLDFRHSQRYCGINIFSVSCTHHLVGCKLQGLQIVRYKPSFCRLKYLHYPLYALLYRLQNLLCQLYTKLCRWYALLTGRLQILYSVSCTQNCVGCTHQFVGTLSAVRTTLSVVGTNLSVATFTVSVVRTTLSVVNNNLSVVCQLYALLQINLSSWAQNFI